MEILGEKVATIKQFLDTRLFFSVPEAAGTLGVDARTVRRACDAGEIPCTKIGASLHIPTAWLRQQALLEEK